MYQPLLEIDANPRRPGFAAAHGQPKADSSSVAPSSGGKPNRNPFRHSAPEPFSRATQLPSPRVGMSPAAGSKIPRKTGTPTSIPKPSQTGGGKPSRPTASSKTRGGHIPVPNASSALSKPKTSPPANRDKPLPSPPLAQLVNPTSPPKARRTLIDAEVTGTPSSEEWPVLLPHNVSPKGTTPASLATSATVSGHATPNPKPQQGGGASDNAISNLAAGLLSEVSLDPNLSSPLSLLSDKLSSGSSSETIHAVTTAHDEALESPLDRKLAVPRGLTRPASSEVSTENGTTRTVRLAVPPLHRQAKPNSTKWPVLGANERQQSPSVVSPLLSEPEHPGAIPSVGDILAVLPPNHSQSGSGSPKTISNVLPSPNSSDQPSRPRTRVKRLSGRSAVSGLGPVLRIADDADAVLFGDEDRTSSLTYNPRPNPTEGHQDLSLGASAGRLSRRTASKISVGARSRSNTPQSGRAGMNGGASVKADSTRSVPSLGKHSVDAGFMHSSSVHVPSQESPHLSRLPSPIAGDGRELSGSCPREVRDRNGSGLGNFCSAAVSTISVQPADGEDFGIPSTETHNEPSVNNTLEREMMPKTKMWTHRTTSSPIFAPAYGTGRFSAENPDSPHARPSLVPNDRMARFRRERVSTQSTEPRAPSHVKSEDLSTPGDSTARSTVKNRGCAVKPKVKPLIEMKDGKGSSCGNDMVLKERAAKVKAKRSFRNFFHLKEGKRGEKAVPPADNMRPSLTLTDSSLAKRFRHSANLSKMKLPTFAQEEPEGGLRSRDGTSSSSTQTKVDDAEPQCDMEEEGPSTACSDTAVMVTRILNRIANFPETSPDRLRGLEIAEVVLNSVEAYRQAKISAAHAKKYARQAELSVHRAGMELERLQKLCRPDFDDETVRAVRALVNSPSFGEREE